MSYGLSSTWRQLHQSGSLLGKRIFWFSRDPKTSTFRSQFFKIKTIPQACPEGSGLLIQGFLLKSFDSTPCLWWGFYISFYVTHQFGNQSFLMSWQLASDCLVSFLSERTQNTSPTSLCSNCHQPREARPWVRAVTSVSHNNDKCSRRRFIRWT